jgi:hypothetical protein
MNWRRGLLRLWLVLSLGWIVSIGVAWETGLPLLPSQDEALDDAALDACLEAKQIEGVQREPALLQCVRAITPPSPRMTFPAAVREYGALALLPPLAVLVLGFLGVWVVSCFARKGA